MTEDALELQIQDYLDGRMSDGERREFEKRLATDAGLAGRVRELRTISEALGRDAPDLPPGFHTRLRARFEARHAPSRRWFRPLSWETAGLVAAVAVAAVLFVPFVVERPPGRPESQILREPSDKESRQSESWDAVEEDRLEAIGGEGLEPEDSSTSDGDDSRFAPSPESPPAPVAEAESEPQLERRDAPAKPRPAPATGAKQKMREPTDSLQGTPAEPDRATRYRQEKKGAAAAPAEAESRTASGRAAVGDVKDELREESDASGYRYAPPGGMALTAGVVEAGEVIEIRSAEQWNRLVLEAEAATRGALGDYDPSSRLVLVGARAHPIDCARSAVVAATGAYEIRLAAQAAASIEPVHGCAFRVPADDLPVRVVDPASPR